MQRGHAVAVAGVEVGAEAEAHVRECDALRAESERLRALLPDGGTAADAPTGRA